MRRKRSLLMGGESAPLRNGDTMSLKSWMAGGVSGLVDSLANVADRFIETDDEKAKFKLEAAELIQDRDSELEQTLRKELEAKERMLVAELNQGDSYTKRARPTVVYAGLIFIFINYVFFPLLGRISQAFGVEVDAGPLADLPPDFWYAWGGICATWSIGRTFERRGQTNRVTSVITGSQKPSSLLD